MEGTHTKHEWQQTTKKKINHQSQRRRNIGRPQTRWENDFHEEGTDQGTL